MKKFIAVFVLLCMVWGMTAFGVSPADITLPVEDIYVSDIIYLTLNVDADKPVYAFEAKIEYDKDAVSFKETEEDDCVKIADDEKGKLMFALSSVGEEIISDNGEGLYTFSFKTKKSGKTSFCLTDIIVVFDDMTYYEEEDINKKVSLKVKSLKSSGGSSGGGGSSVSINKPVTSVGSDIPPAPQITEEKKQSFLDVSPDYWGYESIQSLFEKGVINGYKDGSFKPENSITRAEFAKILCLAFSINEKDESISFDDVSEDKWYFEYIDILSSLGIIKGEGKNFYPDREITREEAATLIQRCGKHMKKDFDAVREGISFSDDADISDYAKESIEELYKAGIIGGNGNGSFMPKEKLIRAEAAKMVDNLLLGGEGK